MPASITRCETMKSSAATVPVYNNVLRGAWDDRASGFTDSPAEIDGPSDIAAYLRAMTSVFLAIGLNVFAFRED